MTQRLAWGAVVVLTVVLLGPALAPGYVLTYDMVFVPQQSLLPSSVGLADFLPRAVPQDAVLAALTTLLPGQYWQHLMLIAIVAGSGLGVARLLRREPAWAAAFGAVLYTWSAYLVERLVLGSWTVLVAYAVLPWLLNAALAVRRGVPGAAGRVVLLIALASLSPSGGLLALAVALPICLLGVSRARLAARLAVLAGGLVVQLPWLVPWLISPVRSRASEQGVEAFALRAEGPWGVLVTALGTGGAWNSDVIPFTRGAGLGLVSTIVVVALALLGLRVLSTTIGRSGTLLLTTLAVLCLVLAIAGERAPGVLSTVLTGVPGLSLLRDGHRWLAPLALLLALAAPLGARRLLSRITERGVRQFAAVALVALPVVAMPDAAWGAGGRLSAVDYPGEWDRVRQVVAESAVPGDVVVLPWGAFRSFAWNDRRTVLDPAPRVLPRTAIVDDTLLVRSADGRLLAVEGESARAAAMASTLASNVPLAGTMRSVGAGLVLVESGTAGTVPSRALAGLQLLWQEGSLAIWGLPGGAEPPGVDPTRLWVVASAWALATVAILTAGATAFRGASNGREGLRRARRQTRGKPASPVVRCGHPGAWSGDQ